MDNKIGNEVYVKQFGKNLKIEDVFMVGDEGGRYVYQISYQETTYILKGFKIQVEHLDPEDKRSAKTFEQNLMQIGEVFQEYYFARATSLINPHVAKPLSLDLTVELTKDPTSFSYLHVQIIFEYGGVALDKLQLTTIEQIYNLMRQSANALLFLHNLEIAHFDIKPASMVYDAKKDLLKVVDMGSAFGSSNRKRLGATTVNLEGKIRSATPEFAPPEVLFMEKGLTKELSLSLSLPAIDVYCWAMSFFAILTKRTYTDLRNYFTNYKMGSEADYKKFMKKVVEISLGSVKPKNSREEELMIVISNLLTKALRYKPKRRPLIKDAIHKMRKFERKEKYTLNYSKTELEHIKNLLNLLIDSDDAANCLNELSSNKRQGDRKGGSIVNSLSELSSSEKDVEHKMKDELTGKKEVIVKDKNKSKVKDIIVYRVEDKEEIKTKRQILNDIRDELVKLSCEHEVAKDYLVKYTLELFIQRRPYGHNCICKTCKKVQKLKTLPLSCACIWTKFGEKIKYNNNLTKASYGKCDKGHSLISIDLGLVNDFISSNFTSLMITDYPEEKENLVNSFFWEIKNESVEDIAWILRYTKAVTKLDLSKNKIGVEGAKLIGEALKTNTTLTELDLSNSNIEVEGAKVIGEALGINTTLTQLCLGWNNIGVEGSKVIGEALKTNTKLTELDLSHNNVGIEGARVIGEVLKTNTTLTELDLSHNNIEYEGARVIGEALKTNTTLTKLYLSKNNIGVEGAKVISEVLKTNTTLTKLYLSNNSIGDEGAKLIDKALRTNTTLEILILPDNNIGDEGAKVIGETLKTNITLRKLFLFNNNIGVEGTKAICEALKINTTLSELLLTKNKLGPEGERLLKEAQEKNKHIRIRY